MLHIDVLGEITMKESVADINLPKTPTARHSQCKNQSNGGRLDNRTKRITIVNAKLLGETTSDQSSFVLINRVIWTVLGFEDPLAPNNIDAERSRHKNPSLVVVKGNELINHRCTPGGLTESITMRDRHRMERVATGIISDGPKFENRV